jgi:cobaltochelatase CobN
VTDRKHAGRAPEAAQSVPQLATPKLTARGKDFRIVELQGQLLVCARQYGSCCCGWEEKGRLPFDPQELWGAEWERRKIRTRVHLTFTGCPGPCAVGNNALLLLLAGPPEGPQWAGAFEDGV